MKNIFKRSAPERDGILEFITDLTLDESKLRECDANSVSLSDEEFFAMASKPVHEYFSSYRFHFRKRMNWLLLHYLNRVDTSEICFLGCGCGTEIILALEAGLKPECIYASDLAFSSVKVVSLRLQQRNQNCVLFTSDLDDVPLKRRDIPIVINDALHHTPEMHEAVERMMAYGYSNLFLSEPVTNFLMKWLATKSIARRIEYSGIMPGRIEIPRLRNLCDKYGYSLSFKTIWVFPEDYYRKLPIPESAFLVLCDMFSALTRPAHLGTSIVCHCAKV